MEKTRVRGEALKLRRKQHPLLCRQKNLAHAVGISERKLRYIENGNDEWDTGVLAQLAGALAVDLGDIAFSVEGPRLVPPSPPPAPVPSPVVASCRGKQLIPRFEKSSAGLVRAAGDLFASAHSAEVVKVEYQIALDEELTSFAEELVQLSREASRETHPFPYYLELEDPRAAEIQQRMRWLLIQLKGNDVFTFVCDHMKMLPESDEIVDRKFREYQNQAIIAFAPQQEWHEESVDVDVDNGQPYIIDWDAPITCPKPTASSG